MNTGETIALIKAFGNGSGSSLPPVTPSDNGKVLTVADGAWVAQAKKFLVTLTPTALDYSGTMDKTVAEINAAYEAGMEIVFRVYTGSGTYYDIVCNDVYIDQIIEYPSFCAIFVHESANVIVKMMTPLADDGTLQTYSTKVYSLTPAS